MLTVTRPPRTDDELYWLIAAMWGVRLPRKAVCPGHVSPFHAVAHAYFAREPNYAVWYASRGSGKSLALAALGLTKALVDEVDVTLIGGSMVQSLNVRNHMTTMLASPHAPRNAVTKDLATLLQTTSGTKIEPLPASQKTVRGKHPVLELLDEVDEMDLDIYDASLGQAMEQPSRNPAMGANKLAEYVVASSTWQNPEGTFSEVIDRAREQGHPVFTWCWRELLEEHGGWMSQRFIDAKRKTVSAQMWKTEYELNEPSGTSRAFDLDLVDQYFLEPDVYGKTIEERHRPDDDTYIWSEPQPSGIYAVGADWGKEKDKTVITVVDYAHRPYKIVKARVVNRQSWQKMISWYNKDLSHYQAVGQHDKTGLGSVIQDFIDDEDDSGGFVFVGRHRTQMLLDYIVNFEHGHFHLPKQLATYYRAHRSTTVSDVYAPSKWNSHLPDEVASMGLVNRAIEKMGTPTPDLPDLAKRPGEYRRVDAGFHVMPQNGGDVNEQMRVRVISDEAADGYDLMDFSR